MQLLFWIRGWTVTQRVLETEMEKKSCQIHDSKPIVKSLMVNHLFQHKNGRNVDIT